MHLLPNDMHRFLALHFPGNADIAVLSFAGHEPQSHCLQQNQTPFQMLVWVVETPQWRNKCVQLCEIVRATAYKEKRN